MSRVAFQMGRCQVLTVCDSNKEEAMKLLICVTICILLAAGCVAVPTAPPPAPTAVPPTARACSGRGPRASRAAVRVGRAGECVYGGDEPP